MTSITGRCRAICGLASKDLTLASWKNLILPNGDTKSPFWASTTLHYFICGSNVLESGSWWLPTISERGYLWNGLVIIRRAFSKLGRICILATVVFQKECAASDMYMYLHIRRCLWCMTISNAATYSNVWPHRLTLTFWWRSLEGPQKWDPTKPQRFLRHAQCRSVSTTWRKCIIAGMHSYGKLGSTFCSTLQRHTCCAAT